MNPPKSTYFKHFPHILYGTNASLIVQIYSRSHERLYFPTHLSAHPPINPTDSTYDIHSVFDQLSPFVQQNSCLSK